MKNFLLKFVGLVILILIFFLIILSTVGIKTNKFNDLITKKINQSNQKVNLDINKIKFKLDLKELSLFLETLNPKIKYKNLNIPAKNIKVYVDFGSLLLTSPKIKKISLSTQKLEINQLKRLATTLKPSNFKSFINNKLKQGKITSEIEFYLNNANKIKNYIARGNVSDFSLEIKDDLILDKVGFNFLADKTDILIKNIFGRIDNIKISEGDLKSSFDNGINIEANFYTNLKYNDFPEKKYLSYFRDFKNIQDIKKIDAKFINTLSINLDETLKIKNFNLRNKGKINHFLFKLKNLETNNQMLQNINQLDIFDSDITTNFDIKKNNFKIFGKYSINGNKKTFNYEIENEYKNLSQNMKLNFDFDQKISLNIINYEKPENTNANISSVIAKKGKLLDIKEFELTEKKNLISISGLKIEDNNFKSLKKALVKTYNKGEENNNFSIIYGKKIIFDGSRFDASNLAKIFKQKTKKNNLSKINKSIEVDFKKIKTPLSKNLDNFKLIGYINKGKFSKITAKGGFGNKQFLDISMKNNKNKKFLEIYSDLPQPLLTEYSFFKGLTGGTLMFSSVFDDKSSKSQLKINDFKVINAPGMIKLLSLADLGGLADLAEGEGLSFDALEINMNSNKEITTFDEIIAVGPSISVLMDGYQDKNSITSLRGTLVPAKNLNKLISKIPVIGNIIIPKDIGEGLFGISFKLKGPEGKIKTTINPIRTVTPRFIQKIIDKNKKSK